MAYGVILKHLEVDKITWGSFLKMFCFLKRGVAPFKRGATAFSAGKRGGVPFS
jgi:hypothetical protein